MRPRFNIDAAPFVKILPAVVAGILVARWCSISVVWFAALLLPTVACAVVWRNERAGGWLVLSAVVLFAAVMTRLTTSNAQLPFDRSIVQRVRVTDNALHRGRWDCSTVRVESYRSVDDTVWHRSSAKLLLYTDTAAMIAVNTKLTIRGRVTDFDDRNPQYATLMRSRGYVGRCYVGDAADIVVEGVGRGNLPARMQRTALERIDRLGLDRSAGAVCKAMALGYRGDIDFPLREQYRCSGVAHLLAVSGLHVGMVALLVNLLLYLLPLFGAGHIVKNILAVAAVWLFAAVAGMSPSVVRAAIMFTGLQCAFALSRSYNALNIAAAAATIMLIVNPDSLSDTSFQLSFAAVIGLLLFYDSLGGFVLSRSKWVNALVGLVVVSAVATFVTAPLVSHLFGRLSIAGILIAPLVTVTANIILLVSLVWVTLPVGALSGVVASILNCVAGFQNDVVRFCSSIDCLSFEYTLSMRGVMVCYALLLLVWVVVCVVVRRKNSTATLIDRRGWDTEQ